MQVGTSKYISSVSFKDTAYIHFKHTHIFTRSWPAKHFYRKRKILVIISKAISKPKMKYRQREDEGFAWIVLLACLFYNTLEVTVFMSPSILLMSWDEHFDSSKAQLGAVGSIMSSMTSIAGASSWRHHMSRDVNDVLVWQVLWLVTWSRVTDVEWRACAELSSVFPVS